MTEPAPATPAGPDDQPLRRSLSHCRRVTRRRARNFYYALRLTPEPRRSALYTIYAFMRACDDLADESGGGGDAAAALAAIERFRAQMHQAVNPPADGPLPPGPLWPALRRTCGDCRIDPRHLDLMLDGQRWDLERNRCDHFEQLRTYCRHVAGVVGLVCIAVWGHDGHRDVEPMAEQRGIALQLTNILRDLVEDARRDRVYLPADELRRFGYEPEEFRRLVLAGEADERFDRLMAFQLERAVEYYRASADLDAHIDANCRPTSWALMHIYRRLLERIAAEPRRVLRRRVRLSGAEKLLIGIRATWRRAAP